MKFFKENEENIVISSIDLALLGQCSLCLLSGGAKAL